MAAVYHDYGGKCSVSALETATRIALGNWIDGVPWTLPLYGRRQVDAAGLELRRFFNAADYPQPASAHEAMNVMSNWRASHGYPLHVMQKILLSRAKRIDPTAITAQRLKRLHSIGLKLTRQPHMRLSRMQDFGGCRAIMADIAAVRAVDSIYASEPLPSHEFSSRKDYISTPKLDGYTGIHLVYKFMANPARKTEEPYSGLRIEIQLRSTLQHVWATAVETVDTFTDQALKSNIGSPSWKRFFALMATACAMREGRALIPGTPSDRFDLALELRKLSDELGVEQHFDKWCVVVPYVAPRYPPREGYFILSLDSESLEFSLDRFKKDEFQTALKRYLEIEENNIGKSNVQAVLVSAGSLLELRKAYPNYYADTTAFLHILKESMNPVA